MPREEAATVRATLGAALFLGATSFFALVFLTNRRGNGPLGVFPIFQYYLIKIKKTIHN